MDWKHKIDRKTFIKRMIKTCGGVFAYFCMPFHSCRYSERPPPDNQYNLFEGKVVHMYSEYATGWDYGTDYYENHVNQDVINSMVNEGIQELTGTPAVSQAWQILIRDYSPGKAIAVKVHFNNNSSCDTSSNIIDALIHPVNAVIQGLKQIGVQEQDIWIFDICPRRYQYHYLSCLLS